MYFVGDVAPRLHSETFATWMRRPNTVLLIPWRMAAMALHFCAWIAIVRYRDSLIHNTIYGEASTENVQVDPADKLFLTQTTDFVLALVFLLFAFTSYTFLSGRTTKMEWLNFMHCICDTLCGIFYIEIWFHTSHVIRVWHVWFFFQLIPAAIEVLVLVRQRLRGMYVF